MDITSGPREIRRYLQAPDALRQIAYNAVMHRTYEGTNAPVRVTWYDDRVEIISPGGRRNAQPEPFFDVQPNWVRCVLKAGPDGGLREQPDD
ncbi:MAG: hypothetical protein OXU64_07480 [Gemmatimonadota bacterium]|nr:hypothetical protein [Gemmatimonadota bacterium]